MGQQAEVGAEHTAPAAVLYVGAGGGGAGVQDAAAPWHYAGKLPPGSGFGVYGSSDKKAPGE